MRVFVLGTAALLASCSSQASEQAEGGACAVVTDCEDGLVCIDGQCSADLSKIQFTETEGGADAGGATPVPVADGGGSDATMGTTTGQDSGGTSMDTGTTTPTDSGASTPQDSGGSSPADAATGG